MAPQTIAKVLACIRDTRVKISGSKTVEIVAVRHPKVSVVSV